MQWTIRKKIIGAFLLVIINVALMSVFTYWKVGELNDTHVQASRSNMEKMVLAKGIAADLANEAVAMRRFNFTGDPEDIKVFASFKAAGNDKMEQLGHFLTLDKNKELMAKIKQSKEQYEAIAEKSFAAKKAEDAAAVGGYMNAAGAPYKEALRSASEIADNVDIFVRANEEETAKMAASVRLTLWIVNIVVGILALCIGWYLSRKIASSVDHVRQGAAVIAGGDLTHSDLAIETSDEIGELADGFNHMKKMLQEIIGKVSSSAEQVTASSEELTSSAEQSSQASEQVAQAMTAVAQKASSQLHAIDAVSSVVENLSASLEEAAASVQEVSQKSTKAAGAALNGAETVQQTEQQMKNIEQSVAFSAETVARLGDSSKEIGQIVDTISGIAGQTNLLALNAAIEAARAGEQGRGFAVVAEEVRHLAEQSGEAAKQITVLISNIQADTGKAVTAMETGTREVRLGVEVVNRTGEAFVHIEDVVRQVAAQMKEMSSVIEQMAQGSQQIVSSVSHLDVLSREVASESQNTAAITQEQTATATEIASASMSLASMSQELQNAVAAFRH